MNYTLGRLLVVVSACFLGTYSLADQVSVGELAAQFADPPRESRPMVWWHWMNGNITKDGIRKDLEWMNRAGIRGFHQFDGALQTPQVVKHPLAYMTPEWKDAFRYTFHLADSLGMETGIASSPGWSSMGGPWVKPEDGMKKIVWREMTIEGGRHISVPLPNPWTTSGPFQNVGQVEYLDVSNSNDSLYHDIAVVALRVPDNDGSLTPSSVTMSGKGLDISLLLDGDAMTGGKLMKDDKCCWIEYHFDKPATVRSIVLSDAGGRLPIVVKADGKVIATIPISPIQQQTISFDPVTASVFRLETTPIPPSPIMNLLGIKGSMDSITINEFELFESTRVNAAEAKAGFMTNANLYSSKTAYYRPLGLYTTSLKPQAITQTAIDITRYVKDGKLSWDIPEGKWKIYRFGWSLTGKKNAPAPVEATGLEVDKLSLPAIKRYLGTYLSMYKDVLDGDLSLIDYMMFDSWEAGNENWTPGLREEFDKRNGYDMLPWMPALTGQVVSSTEETEKFLLDWRRTLEDIVAENYDHLSEILRSYGIKGRYGESHEGGRALVADGMDLKRSADIPMCAIWAPGAFLGSPLMTSLADMRESASVAHIYGQKIVAAESMTAVGLNGYAYSFYPGNLKATVDHEFASGVNRIVIHDSAHQPLDDYFPGVGLSITGQWFNRHETWAEQARSWTDYLARTSFLMQQGKNISDFLVYYGEDTNITARYKDELPAIPKGYNYDFVNPYALLNVIKYENGCFTAPSGNTWRVLVIDADFFSPAIQQRIDDWKAQGANVCTLKDISSFGIMPDCIASDSIRFVHHSVDDGDIYWINHPSDKAETVSLSLRTVGMKPQLLDPETGTISDVTWHSEGNRTVVEFPMTENDAKFIVFSGKTTLNGEIVAIDHFEPLFTIDGTWKVTFQKHRGAPAEAEYVTLKSYTDSNDEGIKYFSGTAVYNNSFKMPKVKGRVLLDLGKVKNIAEVIVNGKTVRTLWRNPYVVDITDYVCKGNNKLQVNVTNLWPNRLIRDAKLPESEQLTHITFPFYKDTDELQESGLLGPVKIMITKQ